MLVTNITSVVLWQMFENAADNIFFPSPQTLGREFNKVATAAGTVEFEYDEDNWPTKSNDDYDDFHANKDDGSGKVDRK